MQREYLEIQHSFMVKTVSEVGIKGKFFNLIKEHRLKKKNPIVNIIVNGKRLSPFLVQSKKRQGCQLLLLLFSTVLEVRASNLRQEGKQGKSRCLYSHIYNHAWRKR